ncbi:MAG: MarR family transcriptional regulator [Terriglobia bacterium]|jgi:DNA-binding MarR family transcriptional regulator
MPSASTPELINDFLGSTQVFASSVNDVIEARLLRKVGPPQLTLSQFKLLKLVALTDAQTIGDVAAFLSVSNAAASKAVDKLVRQGLLFRREAQSDRRAIQLSLTASSRRVLAAYDAAKDRKLARVFRQFSAQDLQRTADLLDRLTAGIVDHTAPAEDLCLQCGIYYRKKCLVRQLVRRNCFYHRRQGRKNGPVAPRGNGSQ